MIRLLFLLLVISLPSWGQVRLNTLVVKPGQVYEMKGTDILVVDTLILMDSAVLLLNKSKTENFIHVKKLVFHRGSIIDGSGVNGIKGRQGRPGFSPSAPCTSGGVGGLGADGTNGGTGISLFLAFQDIVFHGTASIDVSGGDAGDGAPGGNGGGGAAGTRICAGGNGGQGGPGSNGGNGGDAGNITFQAKSVPELRALIGGRLQIRNFGGNPGVGGPGGGGGYAGLSPVGNTSLDGKSGRKGNRGKDGEPGKPGAISFVDN